MTLMTFWSELNRALEAIGEPEADFGTARDAYEACPWGIFDEIAQVIAESRADQR
jgi:hypothetical protein